MSGRGFSGEVAPWGRRRDGMGQDLPAVRGSMRPVPKGEPGPQREEWSRRRKEAKSRARRGLRYVPESHRGPCRD